VKKIILIPTYNEKENISLIVHAVLGLAAEYHILIIDDNSPDGTAAIVKGLQAKFLNRLFIESRAGKLGLGTAYIHGFKWALNNNYDYIFEMDADFSHNPTDLDRLLAACEKGADVSIGSRYVKGGETENWPWDRKLYSWGGSFYTRLITCMPIKDPTHMDSP
jgi:dolichol-phosphate mannosyltransferase